MMYTCKRTRLPTLLDHTTESRHLRESPDFDGRTAIVAVVRNAVRQKMDVALSDLKSLVHVESVGDALHRVRETPVSVLLVSPEILKSGETTLLSKTLSATARGVAVLDDGHQDAALLLRLGACGLTEAVDLRNCEGWNDLRKLLYEETDPVTGRIATAVFHHLDGADPGARRFFAHLVRGARATRTVRAFAGRLGILPSTLMSRFYRANLPSPKTLLAGTRLLFAKALLENSRVSISSVAFQLRYSSPQAFGRHVRSMLGIPVGEFRSCVSFDHVAHVYLDNLILRHLPAYRTFNPFASFGGAHAMSPEHAGRSHAYH